MRTIKLDAGGWSTMGDFTSALKAAIGAPDWHGTTAAAFIDSMVAGGINALEPPYVVEIVNTARLTPEVMKFVRDVSCWVEETRASRLARTGENVGVWIRIVEAS